MSHYIEQLQLPAPPPTGGPCTVQECLLMSPDPRFTIEPASSPPYKWIYHLKIKLKNGNCCMGTGFEVNATTKPEKKVILTCAHNLYFRDEDEYASEVIITNSSQTFVANSSQLWVSSEYIGYSRSRKYDEANNYDFGVIYVEGNSAKGFGWSCSVADEKLKDTLISVCGYTERTKLEPAQLVISGGPITEVSERMLYYDVSTNYGQSGSPVYTWINEKWTVVGIHAFGFPYDKIKINSCVRLKNEYLHSISSERGLELQPKGFCED